jgi:hypothetical membrane protein
MLKRNRLDSLTDAALWIAFIVPFAYFGAQLVAAPFYPGYDFFRQVASELGSGSAPRPWILNTGLFIVGGATVIGSVGLLLGLRRNGVHPVLAWLAGLVMAVSAVGTLKAGIYPMPDPRHASGGLLGASLMIVPLLLTISLWKDPNAKSVRLYLICSLLLVVCCIPFVSGAIQINLDGYRGLVQRVFALAVFPPIAVVALYLLRARIRQS